MKSSVQSYSRFIQWHLIHVRFGVAFLIFSHILCYDLHDQRLLNSLDSLQELLCLLPTLSIWGEAPSLLLPDSWLIWICDKSTPKHYSWCTERRSLSLAWCISGDMSHQLTGLPDPWLVKVVKVSGVCENLRKSWTVVRSEASSVADIISEHTFVWMLKSSWMRQRSWHWYYSSLQVWSHVSHKIHLLINFEDSILLRKLICTILLHSNELAMYCEPGHCLEWNLLHASYSLHHMSVCADPS